MNTALLTQQEIRHAFMMGDITLDEYRAATNKLELAGSLANNDFVPFVGDFR